MKNKILLIVAFISLINLVEAQNNFGKRKFARNLFSRNIPSLPREIVSVQQREKKTKQKISLEDK